MVQRHAVAEAVGAAGIEGDVAADGADRLARRIGRVVEAERNRRRRDVEVDHAGLDHGDAIDRVDLEDAGQPVERDDDAVDVRHRPAGQAGAAAAGDERHAGLGAQAHDRDDLVGRVRQDDGARTRPERRQAVRLEGGQAGRRGDDPGRRHHPGERRQQLGRTHGRYGSRSRTPLAARGPVRARMTRVRVPFTTLMVATATVLACASGSTSPTEPSTGSQTPAEAGFVVPLQRPRPHRLDRRRRRLRGGGRGHRLQGEPGRHALHDPAVSELRRPPRVQAAAGRQQRPRHPLSRLGRLRPTSG